MNLVSNFNYEGEDCNVQDKIDTGFLLDERKAARGVSILRYGQLHIFVSRARKRVEYSGDYDILFFLPVTQ
jgi:hypothetical protein